MKRVCRGNEGQGERLRTLLRALHCSTRWVIIECIGDGAKSTKEIQECLREHEEDMTAPCLYYHLAELKKAGILAVSGYKEEGGGAPEKVWSLKSRRIVIDLLEGADGRNRSNGPKQEV
ncbi:MAG TPA: ArsR family transcriptional regulator [Methanomicrobia archaeon]|nr:ArsR family transcriptional regulator [Methanomicrobia archaeon]